MRLGELTPPLARYSTQRLQKFQVSQPPGYEYGNAGPPFISRAVAQMRDTLPPHHPSSPTAGGRPCLGVNRAGLAPFQLQYVEEGPVSRLSSTVELSLVAGTWASWSQGCEHWRAGSATCLLCSEIGKRDMPPSCPSPPMVGRKTGPKIIRAGQLPLPLIYSNSQESASCTLPGQHSRAGCGV